MSDKQAAFKAPENSGIIGYHTSNGKPLDEEKLTKFLNDYEEWKNNQPPEGPDSFVTTPE